MARARFVEDLVAERLDNGVTQYVILGAGLKAGRPADVERRGTGCGNCLSASSQATGRVRISWASGRCREPDMASGFASMTDRMADR